MLILNLGCGNVPIGVEDADVINHDLTKHSPWVDLAWDLNEYPWFLGFAQPIDEIRMVDVLEHLEKPVRALEECWLLLKPQGILRLRVPYGKSDNAMTDPTHIHFFMPKSLDYFVRGTEFEQKYGYYSKMRWKVLRFEHQLDEDNLYWDLEKDAPAA